MLLEYKCIYADDPLSLLHLHVYLITRPDEAMIYTVDMTHAWIILSAPISPLSEWNLTKYPLCAERERERDYKYHWLQAVRASCSHPALRPSRNVTSTRLTAANTAQRRSPLCPVSSFHTSISFIYHSILISLKMYPSIHQPMKLLSGSIVRT